MALKLYEMTLKEWGSDIFWDNFDASPAKTLQKVTV